MYKRSKVRIASVCVTSTTLTIMQTLRCEQFYDNRSHEQSVENRIKSRHKTRTDNKIISKRCLQYLKILNNVNKLSKIYVIDPLASTFHNLSLYHRLRACITQLKIYSANNLRIDKQQEVE